MPKFGSARARPVISTHEDASYAQAAAEAHAATIIQTAIDDDGRLYRVNLNDPPNLPMVSESPLITQAELVAVLNEFAQDSYAGEFMALAIEPELLIGR
jgi:hypothetical protein